MRPGGSGFRFCAKRCIGGGAQLVKVIHPEPQTMQIAASLGLLLGVLHGVLAVNLPASQARSVFGDPAPALILGEGTFR